jgi:Rod binding domain-containing protein
MKLGVANAALTQQADNTACPSKRTADAECASRACKEFESILIYHMLSTMRKAFESEDDSGLGFGGDIFKSMMDEQLSIALARAGGIGLAELLERGLGLESEDAGPGTASALQPQHVATHPAGPRSLPLSAAEGVTEGAGRTGDANDGQTVGGAASSWIRSVRERLQPHERTIKAASRVFGVDANVIRAVIMQESGGDLRAVSNKGAKGLMQLTDATAQDLGVTNPFDPVQNIFGGARLLSRLLGTFKGNLELALASYNAGLGAVRKYGGIPPYRETQDYVKRVTDYLAGLQRQPGSGG